MAQVASARRRRARPGSSDVPEVAERILHRPRPCGLEGALAQPPELPTTGRGEVAAPTCVLSQRNLVPVSRLSPRLPEHAILAAPHYAFRDCDAVVRARGITPHI